MIVDKKELLSIEQAYPIIAIIDEFKDKSTIEQAILKVIELNHEKKVSLIFYKTIKEYLDKSKILKESFTTEKGLIDLDWIKSITTERPSCLIYLRYQNTAIAPGAEEQAIYSEIKKLQEDDRNIQIILFVINQQNPHALETDDRENPYNLKKLIDKIFFVASNDILKFKDFRKALSNLFRFSRDYYKKLKAEIKTIKQKSIHKEDIINLTIKLGYISMMKSKKLEYTKTKYFDEAYNILTSKDFNIGKYYYGNVIDGNLIFNFYQIRAAADWLFYKIYKIGGNVCKNILDLIQKFNKHYDHFAINNYYPNDPQKNIICNIIDCYWKSKTIEFFIDTLDNINSKNSKLCEAEGFFSLKQIYSLTRITKYLEKMGEINLANIKIENQDLSIDKLFILKNRFYEKLPNYAYLIDPLNSKPIGFIEDVFYKKFLLEKKLEPEAIRQEIRNNLYPKSTNYFEKIKKDSFIGLDLYLNSINLMNDSSSSSNNKQLMNVDLKCIFSNLEMSKSSIYFPKIYFTYLCKYNDYLIQKYNSGEPTRFNDKLSMFINLIKLGNQRILRDEEEEVFFKLFKDEDLINPKIEYSTNPNANNSNNNNTSENSTTTNSQISENPSTPSENTENHKIVQELISVNSINNEIFNNNLFNFDYKIIGGNDKSRKVLELVEYQFTFSTCLKKEKLKFNSIDFIFANNKRIKKFSSFPNELSYDSPVVLDYKLFLKDNENNLMLEKVLFTFEGAQRLKYEIRVHSSKDKIIMLEQISKKVLDFRTPKLVKVGEDEYYHFECEIFKEPSYDVEIGSLGITFYPVENRYSAALATPQNSNNNTTKPLRPTSMAASFEKMAQAKNLNNNNQKTQTISTNKPSTSMASFFKGETGNTQPTISLSQTLNNLSNKANSNNNALTVSSTIESNANNDNSSNTPNPENQAANPPKKKRDPEFYNLAENGNLSEPLSKHIFQVENFEELYKNGKTKVSFLVKFRDKGQYTIAFDALYTIVKKEIEDDSIELADKGKINFDVVSPFTFKFDENCSIYMSVESLKLKKYDINKNIIVKLNLQNELDNNIMIKNIVAITEDDAKVDITSSLTKILALENIPLKTSLLSILKSSEYTIPFNCIFKEAFNKKSFGKISIDWTTESLKNFSENVCNNNVFPFPEIFIEPFNFDLNYEVNNYDKNNNNVNMKVIVTNKADDVKRIEIDIEQLNFLVQGNTQKKVLIMPYEKIEVDVTLYPPSYGILKLPSVKVREYDFSGTNKLYSIYNFCQNLNIEL